MKIIEVRRVFIVESKEEFVKAANLTLAFLETTTDGLAKMLEMDYDDFLRKLLPQVKDEVVAQNSEGRVSGGSA